MVSEDKGGSVKLNVGREEKDAWAVKEWAKTNSLSKFTRNEVRRAFKGRWSFPGRMDFALDVLISKGLIDEPYLEKTEGRYAAVYRVNVNKMK